MASGSASARRIMRSLTAGSLPFQEHAGKEGLHERRVADHLDLLANGLLGQLGITGGQATAVHQDQPSHPLGRLTIGLQDHATAQAVPNEDGRCQLQGVEQGAYIGPVSCDITLRWVARGGAMAAQIDGDHALPGTKKVQLGLPVVMRAGQTMNEDERRVARARSFIEESGSRQGEVGHGSFSLGVLLTSHPTAGPSECSAGTRAGHRPA